MYLEWLSKAAYSQKVREEAGKWFRASLTPQEIELDRERNQEMAEYAHHLRTAVVAWETSGHQIEVRPATSMYKDFEVSVDGEIREYDVHALKPCVVPGRPEIVARLGKAGLTEERRQAILKLRNFD